MNFLYEKNRIYLNDDQGQMIAEVTFPEISPGIVDINHTFVDGQLRGQGVANALMLALVKKLDMENKKAKCSCSYAVTWFERHSEYQEVLNFH